jgi:hypothetical protein
VHGDAHGVHERVVELRGASIVYEEDVAVGLSHLLLTYALPGHRCVVILSSGMDLSEKLSWHPAWVWR